MARPAKIDEKTGMVETGFSEKPSPVIELVDKANPDKVIAWACSKCGSVLPDERLAREHCLLRICECGNECRQYHTACDTCIKKKQVERDRVKREAAEVISADDYDGSVYDEQEDRYFPDTLKSKTPRRNPGGRKTKVHKKKETVEYKRLVDMLEEKS